MSQDIRLQARLSQSSVAVPWWLASAGLAFAVGIAYFLSARLGLALLTTPDGVAVFWPAAGVSAGSLIALGRGGRWPVVTGVVVATIAANLLGDRNLWSAIVFGLCNAGEAILAAALIERGFGQTFDLARLNHVLGLLVAAIAATAASGIGGTLGYIWFHPSATPVLSIWYHWFASDALGIIAVAPLLIGCSIWRYAPLRTELLEPIVALVLLTLVAGFGIFAPRQPWAIAIPIALLFPLFLWLAARCSPVFSAAAAFIVAIAIIYTTTFGIGLFAIPNIPASSRVPAAQAGVLTVSLCVLVLAALFAERRQHAEALERSEERSRLALQAGGKAAFDLDMRTGALVWNDEFYRMYGYPVGEVEPGRAAWLARVHPEDREAAAAVVNDAERDHKNYINDFRTLLPDGRVRWIRAHGQFLCDGEKPIRTFGLVEDITDARQQIETQRVLVAELQHRTRNLMAVVQSIAHQTLDTVDSLAAFEGRFNNRLETLSRVQGLLSRADDKPITLGTLIDMELEALGCDAFRDKVAVGGPEARLRKSAVEMLSLAIHELLTNAIKHGALASNAGRLSITWQLERKPPGSRLVLQWLEHGIVSTPSSPSEARRSGYGRTLIEEGLPYSLGAETTFEFGADELRCVISLPLMPDHAADAVS